MSAQGWSLELDAMSAVHDAVEDGVSERGVTEHRVPLSRIDW
jgi:hypothetical protein